ncbi:MAG: glutathione S-transferase N-terminal domain-containing protein [Gammaproteobacteria bacterium]|nr:glutathione S-transferase N-terminal domain-containing protein [Gammaproteobacteria bacterium]
MNITLYQDPICPFCMRVKSFLSTHEIEIPMRNTVMDISAYKELVTGGGRATVPCLRIERDDGQVEWLYESLDIMRFIDEVKDQLT